ncbi:hypothetical protein HAX54_028555 [Datura stramonium]|uniref:Uncharacterized protein n=1 Tax=Datura stramonium TaxID=4076 RepID=A0ABS8S9N7_DATST|nr:hypothetical protein [Datura stramonium]
MYCIKLSNQSPLFSLRGNLKTTSCTLMHEHVVFLMVSSQPFTFGPTAYFGLLNVIGERTINILKHLSHAEA